MKTFKAYVNETWSELDIKIFKEAPTNLTKAEKLHKKLMTKIKKGFKLLNSKRDDIESQEDGQGQRYDELEEIKSEIQKLNDLEQESLTKINRLKAIINIKK